MAAPRLIHRPPSVEILVKTYQGNERRILSNLIPKLRVFVSRRAYCFSVIQDEETAVDRECGMMELDQAKQLKEQQKENAQYKAHAGRRDAR